MIKAKAVNKAFRGRAKVDAFSTRLQSEVISPWKWSRFTELTKYCFHKSKQSTPPNAFVK